MPTISLVLTLNDVLALLAAIDCRLQVQGFQPDVHFVRALRSLKKQLESSADYLEEREKYFKELAASDDLPF